MWMIYIGICILILIVCIWLYRRKKYTYIGFDTDGLTDGLEDDHLLIDFFNYFYKEKQPKKQRVNKTENKCRKILEELFGVKFGSIRPNWLKSPKTGKNLELDCYNSDMKLALEFNGKQHYAYTPYFHKSKKDFYSQVHRDDWKRKKCKEHGITLIEIPYWVTEIDLEKYIKAELRKKGFAI